MFPQDLKSWIEGAKEGVIYFSLGSNMLSASLKEDKRRAIIDSFNQFPHHRVRYLEMGGGTIAWSTKQCHLQEVAAPT